MTDTTDAEVKAFIDEFSTQIENNLMSAKEFQNSNEYKETEEFVKQVDLKIRQIAKMLSADDFKATINDFFREVRSQFEFDYTQSATILANIFSKVYSNGLMIGTHIQKMVELNLAFDEFKLLVHNTLYTAYVVDGRLENMGDDDFIKLVADLCLYETNPEDLEED